MTNEEGIKQAKNFLSLAFDPEKEEKESEGWGSRPGLYITCINSNQAEYFRSVLSEFNFKLLRKRTNPVHNNESIICVYIRENPFSKEVPIKKKTVKAF